MLVVEPARDRRESIVYLAGIARKRGDRHRGGGLLLRDDCVSCLPFMQPADLPDAQPYEQSGAERGKEDEDRGPDRHDSNLSELLEQRHLFAE